MVCGHIASSLRLMFGLVAQSCIYCLIISCGLTIYVLSLFYDPGAALSQFGRVHCKIATLQEDYATALRETYMQKLDDGIVAIQEYQALRKKLDSRR